MKIEKINDNQIRCTLNRQDLQSRELKISELAYGTQKAKDLFHDMIEQADREFGFSADDMPLMIEAIPVSVDCIVLVITKVEDPEELDTRFSRFAPSDDDGSDNSQADALGLDALFGDAEADSIEGLDGYFPDAKKDTTSSTEDPAADSMHMEGKIEIPADSFIPFAEALQDIVEKFATKAGSALSDVIKEAELIRADEVEVDKETTNENVTDSSSEDTSSEMNANEPSTDNAILGALPGINLSEIEINDDAFEDDVEDIAEAVEDTSATDAPTEEGTIDESAVEEPSVEESKEPELITRVFSFHNYDEAAYAATQIDTAFDGESCLFKDERQGLYFLTITGTSEDANHFYAVSNELTEYSCRVRFTYATNAYLAEHCRAIIKHDALNILKNY